jgi:hypothetical protein
MTQLMVVPIRDKGDAVLIVSLQDGEPVIGYVTNATLRDYFQHDLTNCDGLLLVKSNLQSFETMLAAKSKGIGRAAGAMPLVEIALADVRNSGRPLCGA